MRGLPIRQPYIDMILAGRKTWEMRSRRCHFREQIALIRSKSLTVVGVADVIDCVGPLTDEKRLATILQHGVTPETWLVPGMDKYRFAWVLSNVRRLPIPVPYHHNFGAAQWVTLGDGVAQEIAAQLVVPQ